MRLTSLCARISKLALMDEKELIVKVPWGKLTALTWGDPSNPPVLLCHGRLDACTSFRPLVQHLPSNYHYVSVDLPGNGRSDHFPRGAKFLVTDFLPALERLRDHLKWERFVYVGHSLGALLGKLFNHLNPGQITHMVDLDPQPAYLPALKDLKTWYRGSYRVFYGDEGYDRLTAGKGTAPRYSYDEARNRVMKARSLTEEAAEHILERSLEDAGDGLYRFTYDQRFKQFNLLPFLGDGLKVFYTGPLNPTLAIFASESVERGFYKAFPFATNDGEWSNGNYRHVVVRGGHDLHLNSPEEVAGHVKEFLGKHQL